MAGDATKANRILFVRTGGTIDAQAYPEASRPPTLVTTLLGEESHIKDIIGALPHADLIDLHRWGYNDEEAGGAFKWDRYVEQHYVRDSQEYNYGLIVELAELIRDTPHNFIVITHGTDAMERNARMLKDVLEEMGVHKTVVFTGAMVPLSMRHQHETDGIEALEFVMRNIMRTGDRPPTVYMVGRDSEHGHLGFFDPRRTNKERPMSLAQLKFILQDRITHPTKSSSDLER
jgi:hypothetical protein